MKYLLGVIILGILSGEPFDFVAGQNSERKPVRRTRDVIWKNSNPAMALYDLVYWLFPWIEFIHL